MPLTPLALDLADDVTSLTAAVCDIESVSLDERALADAVEAALRPLPHLTVARIGNTVVARTDLGRAERVVLAGHIDTVPLTVEPANLPTRRVQGQGGEVLWGRGTVDMKGGVAVMLRIAHEVREPSRDLTFVFYEAEEIDSVHNGLLLVQQQAPDLLADADFAVLLEPTDARIEGGCKGTLRAEVSTKGIAAHSARPWKGHNAIHDAAPVLAILAGRAAYGYEITAWLREQGFTEIAEGTVYALLVRVEQRGLVDVEKVASEKGPPRKVYSLNAAGREYLDDFWTNWGFLADRLEQLRTEGK